MAQTDGMDVSNVGRGRFTRVDHVEQTGSTNVDLIESAKADPTTPLVLIADEQRAGRGRRDREWTMPPGGGLLISFFVPWKTASTVHIVPTCLGVAAVQAAAECGRSVELKWPNDLVDHGDKKLGGMLSSAVVDAGRFAGVVSGLGFNISWPTKDIAELPDAICLDRMGSEPVDRLELATALVSAFDETLRFVETNGVDALHDRYRKNCRTIGQRVRVECGAGSDLDPELLVGIATDIDPSGALLLDVDGVQHRIDVGDVIHLRPSPSVAPDE